eukprot:gene1812-954_t
MNCQATTTCSEINFKKATPKQVDHTFKVLFSGEKTITIQYPHPFLDSFGSQDLSLNNDSNDGEDYVFYPPNNNTGKVARFKINLKENTYIFSHGIGSGIYRGSSEEGYFTLEK